MSDIGFKTGGIEAPYEDIVKLKTVEPKRKTVALADLYTPQPNVNVQQLLKLIKKSKTPYNLTSNNSPFRPDAKYPQVIKYDGKLYIADGNHRLAASKLLGHSSAKVLVYELPK